MTDEQAAALVKNLVPPGPILIGDSEKFREVLTSALVAIESVRLQSHYAALLNDYDGGKRMRFNSDTWLSRLRALREKRDADR